MRNQEEFEALALAVIAEIPPGRVASYSQIARLIGYPHHSRQVGRACRNSHFYGSFPCHRVVNQQGRLVLSWPQQRKLLAQEGVQFQADGRVDMKKYQWEL